MRFNVIFSFLYIFIIVQPDDGFSRKPKHVAGCKERICFTKVVSTE